MSSDDKNFRESNKSASSAHNRETKCQLVIHPNNTSKEDNQFEININIKLNHLINQFEKIFNKEKKLELHYLMQSTQVFIFKLKELQKIMEQLACEYYDDYCDANKNCCNELGSSENVEEKNDIEKKASCNSRLNEFSKYCEKSHLCSSNEGELNRSKNMKEQNNNRSMKCNPCKCSLNASGKKVKTLECKLASKAKKYKRNKFDKFDVDNSMQLKRGDTTLPLTPRRSPTNILTERRISNSKLEIQTNLKNFKLNVKKVNTAIEDITYQNVRERNQAVYCNLSSESSSEEYYSDSSNDQISYTKRIHDLLHGNPPGPIKESNDKNRPLRVECCGCGERVETIKVGENNTCPCGCDDLVILPEAKYVDRYPSRCDNCGIVLIENRSSKDNKLESSKVYDKSENESDNMKQRQDCCLIPYSDVKVGIELLKDESYGTETIFKNLGDFIKAKNNNHITSVPAYIE